MTTTRQKKTAKDVSVPNTKILAAPHTTEETLELQYLFSSISPNSNNELTIKRFWRALNRMGILRDDPRLKNMKKFLKETFNGEDDDQSIISFENFRDIINQNAIVRSALKGTLSIPAFNEFCNDIEEIYVETKKNKEGEVAAYIPQLARVDPDFYAISVCTVDGQRFSIGDSEERFCLQSTSKPINYCLAHEKFGEEYVHQHVGREPSGQKFNEITLNTKGLPHNPLINAGAIMCCSIINNSKDTADAFETVMDTWKRMGGGKKPGFNNSVYQSERGTADRNFALAYFMRENKGFPDNTDIVGTLEFYFQCCSIEVDADMLSIVASTLANAGVCPLTNDRIFSPKTVQNCLSLMSSCGMYDYSGEFAFTIGLPAKSGVSGALMVVIPNVGGFAVWAPRLDKIGNSVKGVEFCKKLITKYNFHKYDNINNDGIKIDPRLKKYESKTNNIMSLIWAATYGDIDEIHRLEANGIDLNAADYDGRTALHLASAEGKTETVEYLLKKGVNPNPADRWGGTPLTDAQKGNHKIVADLLVQHGGK